MTDMSAVIMMTNEIDRLRDQVESLMVAESMALEEISVLAILRAAAEASEARFKSLLNASVCMEHQLQNAVNAHCTCGGDGPGNGCVACDIYHAAWKR